MRVFRSKYPAFSIINCILCKINMEKVYPHDTRILTKSDPQQVVATLVLPIGDSEPFLNKSMRRPKFGSLLGGTLCRAVYKEHLQQFSRLYFKNFPIHIHEFHYFGVVLTRKPLKLAPVFHSCTHNS